MQPFAFSFYHRLEAHPDALGVPKGWIQSPKPSAPRCRPESSCLLHTRFSVVQTGWAAVVVVPARRVYRVGEHAPTTPTTSEDTAGEFPEAVPSGRRCSVVLYPFPRNVYPLAGYARVGNGHSYPLLLGLDDCGGAQPVAPSVGFRYLLGNRAADVVPPYAVILIRLQLGRHLRGDQFLDLIKGVGLVCVIHDTAADKLLAPVPPPFGRVYPLTVEEFLDPMHGQTLYTDNVEHAPHNRQLLLVHFIAVSCYVEREPVIRRVRGDYLPWLSSAFHGGCARLSWRARIWRAGRGCHL